MTVRRRLRRSRRVAAAALALGVARLELAIMSEAAVLRRLRTAATGMPPHSASDRVWLEETAWALQGVARRLPWRTNCLVRTLAAERLVRRRGLLPSIRLQAGLPGGRFSAHVCLSCGGVDMSGGPIADLVDLL